ncbi:MULTISPECIES: hypothetical protein [Listeria]|uniref:hypothetical protein n=1 Tax=Listeria TaxID=1637 RepID=UPI000B58D0D1|nr:MULTISPECIES: hypothetical protein [Listeria]
MTEKKKNKGLKVLLSLMLGFSFVFMFQGQKAEALQVSSVLYYYEKGFYRTLFGVENFTRNKNYRTISYQNGASYTTKTKRLYAYQSGSCTAYTRTWKTY